VPWRFYSWGLALLLSLLLPLMTLRLGRHDPQVQAEIDRTAEICPSVVERFGLFTIIVLGEVIVCVVRGVAARHHLSVLSAGTAALGMVIAIGLLWIYFDFASHRLPRPGNVNPSAWMYLHLPTTMGIAAVGGGRLECGGVGR
jgi:low temperature requirement protein LtrA